MKKKNDNFTADNLWCFQALRVPDYWYPTVLVFHRPAIGNGLYRRLLQKLTVWNVFSDSLAQSTMMFQPFPLSVDQVPVSWRAGCYEHTPRQHQRLLRPHHCVFCRLRQRQICCFQFWCKHNHVQITLAKQSTYKKLLVISFLFWFQRAFLKCKNTVI